MSQGLGSLRDAAVSAMLPEGVEPVQSASDGSRTVDSSIVEPAVAQPSAAQPSVVRPLSPGRYSVQFTASAGLHEKLERLRALMRSRVPDGDLGAVIEAAVTEKLERLEARRFASARSPRQHLSTTDTSPASHHIPSAVRRAVVERDGGRCRYVDRSGRRCEERDRLEYHHRHPFALGGDHEPANIRLMCRAHNAYLAEKDYGRKAMSRFGRSGNRGREDPVSSAGGAPGLFRPAPPGSRRPTLTADLGRSVRASTETFDRDRRSMSRSRTGGMKKRTRGTASP